MRNMQGRGFYFEEIIFVGSYLGRMCNDTLIRESAHKSTNKLAEHKNITLDV